jgi:DNA-binding transcriptional LysR family regulator
MQKSLNSGVPYNEHPTVERLRELNWESVRVFLRLHRAGSFRAAADQLGIATNTVRRHVEQLERELGTALVARGVQGVDLTDEGRMVFEAATLMEQAARQLRRVSPKGPSQLSGNVRISVTEGIGTFWVMPRLVEFQRAHPQLIVELNCTMRPSDPGRMEADIGIQISPPTNPELKAIRLGRMHGMPFASRDYLEIYGRPTSIEEVQQRHRIVEQLSPQLYNDAVAELFPGKAREGFVSVVTNTSTAHYWAVAKGAGLGVLPTYLWAIGASVEPVEIGLHTQFDIWMTYHRNTRRIGRVVATIDWLKKLFDPRVFPWFRDEFVPPEALAPAIRELTGPNAFDVFVGRRGG